MDLFGVYKGLGGEIVQILYYALWLIPLFAVFVSVILSIRSKMVFQHPVRIFRVRENGKVIESNYVGGYISRKGASPFFRIKIGKWYWAWWKHIDLTTTPKPEYMDEQNRIYYKQIDVGTFVQLRREFTDLDKVTYHPVESDVKYGAILDIDRITKVLATVSPWQKVLAYGGLMIVAITLIIGYVILLNTKCPV